jgi:hypothetical protein
MCPIATVLVLLVAIPCLAGLQTADRFTVVLDGAAVRDNRTGLLWEREPDAVHDVWSASLARCRAKTVGGRTGWRAPAVEELKTLVDPEERDPALPKGHPFANIRSAVYWSATPSDTDDIVAWHVSFFSGEAVTDQKSQTRRVWCVLGEPTAPGAR